MLKPKAKALVTRTAMIGGGLSYDVYVPTKYVHNYDAGRQTTIVQDGKEYLDYVQASLPEAHYALPKGWDRYDAFLAHEKAARQTMLTLARSVFPELQALEEDTLPSLWTTGLMDRDQEVSAEQVINL